ncbi:MAG: hypothetical protein RIE52_09835 [Balneola sp.]|jgi:carotenoid 1,2-hydratase
MNISTDQLDENPFPNKPSGGYEWWYFDALSEDGNWGLVIIFYQGNPFSPEYIRNIEKKSSYPDEFPAVSISIYNRNKTEFYSFVEYSADDFNWDKKSDSCTVGPHSFSKSEYDSKLVYSVVLKDVLPSGHSIKAELEFSSSIITKAPIVSKSPNEHHFWNLIQPKAEVSGTIEIKGKSGFQKIAFNGSGYHDHNVGLEPMKEDFKDWYWGRYHFKNTTLIYYVMNRVNEKQYKAWLISNENGEVIDEFSSVDTEGFLGNMFGLSSARKITLKSVDSEVTVQAALSLDDGPFYQRFLGQAVMHKDGEVSIAEGISEYIYPENIYSRKFWPAVKMRLRFASKKPHWVQKFKMFYEWTW